MLTLTVTCVASGRSITTRAFRNESPNWIALAMGVSACGRRRPVCRPKAERTAEFFVLNSDFRFTAPKFDRLLIVKADSPDCVTGIHRHGHQRQQLSHARFALPERFFGRALLVDVGVSAEPTFNSAIVVANRHTAR